jgi:REP element-mobilizing transposase RayT
MYPYIGAVLRNFDTVPIQIEGVDDHLHALFVLPRTVTVAQVVEKAKTSSSKWAKTKGVPAFAWQGGYAAFSVGPRDRDAVVAYVRDQESHHRTRSFQDELRALLEEAGIAFDERYVWD